MEDKILIVLQYIAEIVYFWIGATALFHRKIQRKWCAFLGGIILIGMMFWGNVKIDALDVIGALCGLLILALTIKPSETKKEISKWYIIFILIYFEELFNIITKSLLTLGGGASSGIFELVQTIIAIVLIKTVAVAYSRYSSFFKGEYFIKFARKSMIPLVVFLTVELLAVIVSLNILAEKSGNEKYSYNAMALNFGAMISIGILFAMVYFVKSNNDKMKEMLFVEKQIKQVQYNYYEVLLEKEKTTKDYRHDMTNHLVCLDDLINANDLEAAKAYIKKMTGRMEDIQSQGFNTGIKILDALLSFHVGQFSDDVIVSVKGQCKKTLSISEMDLCTIFSNLIQNVVEALQDDELEEKQLFMEINTGRDFLRVKIKNSMRKEKLQYNENGDFLTSKKDKKNHGIGTSNVKEAVIKNNGKIKYDNDDKMFCVEVTLPIN